jgi:hypothetical protein
MLSKSVVYTANATALGDLSDPTTKVSSAVTDAATRVHGTIFGLAWQGTGKRAAEDRATHELAQDKRVARIIEDLARSFTSGQATMQPMIESLSRDGRGLEADGFAVSDDWNVTDSYDYGAGLQALRDAGFAEDACRTIVDRVRTECDRTATTSTSNLQRVARELTSADQRIADAITKGLHDLGVAAPPAAGLKGGQQAVDDFAAVASGNATPDALARIRAATTVTPAQLDALGNGRRADIPQGQFDYLKSLMSAQDTMSLHDINDAARKYPGLQGSMADAYELVGNPNLSTALGDHGGMANEPPAIQSALTGPLWRPFGDKPSSGGATMVPTRALRAFNDMMDRGNPSLRVGSDVDRAALNQASKIAAVIDRGHAVATDEPVTNARLSYSTTDDRSGLNAMVDKMVSHAARDHQAVGDFLMGADDEASASAARMASATGGGFDGNQSFLHLATHQFDAGQRGVNSMIDWIGADSTTPGNNGVIAAGSANALAHLLAEKSDTLGGNIPGIHNPGGATLGLINPELVQTMTKNLVPYLGNLVGVDVPGVSGSAIPGFDDTSEMAGLVKVLSSDPASAMAINRAAAGWENYFSHQYGVTGDSQYARSAGLLVQAVQDGDAGALDAYRANKNWEDIQAFNKRGAEWDTAKTILGTGLSYAGPLGPLMSKGLDIMNPNLRLDGLGMLGDPSKMSDDGWQRAVGEAKENVGDMVDGSYRQYNMLSGYLEAHPDAIPRFQNIDVGSGKTVDFVDSHGKVYWELSNDRKLRKYFDLAFNGLPLDDWDSSENGFDSGLRDNIINRDSLPPPVEAAAPPGQPR